MLLAGLDIGTTGCKVTVYQEQGGYLDRVYHDYPVRRTQSEHEVDANAIWEAVQLVIESAAQKYPGIGGIGITSFGETFVLLDSQDQPLLPAMLYTDPRGEEECAALYKNIGEAEITRITGLAPAAMYSLPKLMWVKAHRPEVFRAAKRVCLMEDYVSYLLTGNARIDYSLATRTMAFDIHRLKWSETVFEAAGIDAGLFSEPVPTGTTVGTVRPSLAKKLGLQPDTIVVAAGHDQIAAAIGSGVFDESCTVDGAGTVECITPVFESYQAEKMASGNYAVVPYVTPGKYACYAFSFTGGALIKWFIDNLAGYAAMETQERGKNIHALLEEGWYDEPTGILVLPHFAGAATPYMDADSKGAIVGLTVAHTQREIYLAIMEGVCYEMRINMERLAEAGVTIRTLRATGGGANSRVWLQMKADILNVPVTALRSEEAGAAGSAMLVGIALGIFRDLDNAAEIMVSQRETYMPRPEVHEKYSAVYQKYKKLYPAVRPLV